MAENKLDIVVSITDQFSNGLNSVKRGIENLQPAFQKMAAIGTVALAGITAAVFKSIDAYADSERATRQLENAVIGVSKGTAEQVRQINEVTAALERKVGIDADSVNMGAAQLSTFGLQTESVVKLTKSLADFTINQNGLSASADNYIVSANTMAKALQGQFGVLEKSGIRFTEAQQQLILFGTETEKVAALQEGLAQNLRETSDTVAGVDVMMAKANNTMGNIQEAIGKAFVPALVSITDKLQPIIEKFAEWADQHPQLILYITLATGGIVALVAIIGTLGLVLPPIIAGINLLGGAFLFMVSTNGLVIAAIGGIVASLIWLWNNSELVNQKIREIFKGLSIFFGEIWGEIKGIVADAIDSILGLIDNVMGKIGAAIQAVKDFLGMTSKAQSNPQITGTINKVTSLVTRKSVNDAIITPKGDVISTHPDDYLIATKNPSGLAGGGITINITGNTLLDSRAAEKIGDLLMKKLRKNLIPA